MADPIISGVTTKTKYSSMYNNQFFDYISEQLPRNMKDMFKWCEHVYFNSPPVVNAVKKLINYPVTDFEYISESTKVKENTRKLLTEDLDMKAHLLNVGINYFVYGNVFRSVHLPFKRMLKCKFCETETAIEHAEFSVKKFNFLLKCPSCKQTGKAEIEDKKSSSQEDFKLLTWNPRQIELFANPVTGTTTYYYRMDNVIKKAVLNKDIPTLKEIPKIFIEALQKDKAIKFDTNFYHLKTNLIDGFSSGWGLPPLSASLKMYLYSTILKKANEAIALERITPKTILFPQANTDDPTLMSSLGDWKDNIKRALEGWKKDPNYTMLAPYPTGVVNVGSQGRGLMVNQEVKQAEEDMIRSLDIPPEFVYGSTNIQNSPVALRMLENQLSPYTDQLTKYVNWIIDKVSHYTGKEYCHIKFTPFKLVDDVMQKQILVNLASNNSGVSMSTIQEAFGLNPEDERKKMKEDQLNQMDLQEEIQEEQQKKQEDIANQAQQDEQAEQQGTVPQYNQQKLIAHADQLAMQAINLEYEQRRSFLAQLQNEDFVMYAMVKARMENMKDQKELREEASQNQGQ